MDFIWYNYGDKGLRDGFAIRQKVFCEEIGFTPEFEFDHSDKLSMHLVVYDAGVPVCNARLFPEGENSWHFGRLRCPAEYRGRGYGKQAVLKCIEKCIEMGTKQITLGAKYDKKGFYEKIGFKAYGDVFNEEGIPHINMKMDL